MKRAATGVLALILAGCSSISVSQDYDTAADFSGLRTYAWFNARPTVDGADGLTSARIVRAVEDEFASRGYRRVEAEKADFLVNAMAQVRQRIEVQPTTVTVGYGWRKRYVDMPGGETVRTYDEGTLVLDVIERESKSLLWRGTARAVVSASRTPEERDARIREAVTKVLAQFPPER